MNVKDSDHMIAELQAKEGYELTDEPEEADLLLINTCSVREKPVSKLFSEIGVLEKIKKEKSLLGVCGCTASHMGKDIIRRAPSVDFVLGARNVSKITEIIDQPKAIITDIDFDDTGYIFKDFRQFEHKDFVNIMVGCDKKCTFCIVPKTRGEELSIPLDTVVKQVTKLSKEGVKEITLLGQNVNNYGRRFPVNHKKVDFTDLLNAISDIEGIKRIRFMSPHPLHADDRFIDTFISNEKICKHIHLPLQSGSTSLLKRMKRGYSKEWFLEKAARLREAKDAAISTDIIVGFPGESDADFEETMEVAQKVRFEQMFSFVYSPRPLTEAASYHDQVELSVAKARLSRLQERHQEIIEEVNQAQIGKTFKVLIDKSGEKGHFGRSGNFFNVEIDEIGKNREGEIVEAMIAGARRHTLQGELR